MWSVPEGRQDQTGSWRCPIMGWKCLPSKRDSTVRIFPMSQSCILPSCHLPSETPILAWVQKATLPSSPRKHFNNLKWPLDLLRPFFPEKANLFLLPPQDMIYRCLTFLVILFKIILSLDNIPPEPCLQKWTGPPTARGIRRVLKLWNQTNRFQSGLYHLSVVWPKKKSINLSKPLSPHVWNGTYNICMGELLWGLNKRIYVLKSTGSWIACSKCSVKFSCLHYY